MARKVFISVLGASNYGSCYYTKEDKGFKSSLVRYIQEATLEYLMKEEEWTSNDVAYILLTEESEIKNWKDNGHKDFKTQQTIFQTGLQTQLQQMKLPFEVEIINELPMGNNEKEIWEIFEKTFEKIQEGDELYFDLTHGFRYIPMLILVLGNYSKFLKNVNVRSITYGNYEGRNKETNEAPIIDLLPLSSLQDWTYAAGQYLNSGNVDNLVKLCENEYKPILKETQGSDTNAANLRNFTNSLQKVIEERQTCRGISIITSENFSKLQKASNAIETTFIPPLNPIFNKIKQSFESFDKNENIKNGFSAAEWCFNNNLFQQSATILQEFVITYVCKRHNIKINDEKKRDLITSAFAIKFNNLSEEKWKNSEADKNTIKEILKDELLQNQSIVESFNALTIVRNDFNHSGMRSKREPMSPINIRKNIEKCIDKFKDVLIK